MDTSHHTYKHGSRLATAIVGSLIVLGILLCASSATHAADSDITIPPGYTQNQFRDLSEEIGLAIAYRPVAPAEPLGILGFDIGVEVTMVRIDSEQSFWTDVAPDVPSYLVFPKLHGQKGLPFGIDVGFVYTKIPDSNAGMIGGELKWAILKGTVATPALAIRGSYTTLTGVETLDVTTTGADVSISKGFGPLTPYAGIGQVWIKSSENIVGLADESITATHGFLGAKLSLLLLTMAAEVDLAKVPSYSFRIGLGF